MMNQQYEILREKNDPLKELIGKSYNERTKFEAEQILKEIHSVSKDRLIDKSALCYILKDDEIKGVGGSTLLRNKKTGEIESNLILNNFGVFMGAMLRKRTSAVGTMQLFDDGNAIRTLESYANGVHFNESGQSVGSRLAVGSGITAVARTDFNIETRLSTAPESGDFIPQSNPVYNLSNSNFSVVGSVTAGGSGTVNEGVCFCRWQIQSGAEHIFALFHDIISPGQVFAISDTIALEYIVQL